MKQAASLFGLDVSREEQAGSQKCSEKRSREQGTLVERAFDDNVVSALGGHMRQFACATRAWLRATCHARRYSRL